MTNKWYKLLVLTWFNITQNCTCVNRSQFVGSFTLIGIVVLRTEVGDIQCTIGDRGSTLWQGNTKCFRPNNCRWRKTKCSAGKRSRWVFCYFHNSIGGLNKLWRNWTRKAKKNNNLSYTIMKKILRMVHGGGRYEFYFWVLKAIIYESAHESILFLNRGNKIGLLEPPCNFNFII